MPAVRIELYRKHGISGATHSANGPRRGMEVYEGRQLKDLAKLVESLLDVATPREMLVTKLLYLVCEEGVNWAVGEKSRSRPHNCGLVRRRGHTPSLNGLTPNEFQHAPPQGHNQGKLSL
jgi:hypothetical protein